MTFLKLFQVEIGMEAWNSAQTGIDIPGDSDGNLCERACRLQHENCAGWYKLSPLAFRILFSDRKKKC